MFSHFLGSINLESTNFLNHLEEALSQATNLNYKREDSTISVNTKNENFPELWLNFSNSKELYLGINDCSQLFYNEDDSWKKGMIEYLKLLSSPIVIKIYLKKDFPYKFKYLYKDQRDSESRFSSINLLFPFWRKSKIETRTFPAMVAEEILSDLREKLINTA